MQRLPRQVGLIAVIAALLAAAPSPAAAVVRAPVRHPSASRIVAPTVSDAALLRTSDPDAVANGTTRDECTGWESTFEPPTSIRVLRTRGPDEGHVETVDFRTYVGWVISAEWPARYPLEALKAGAVAVKQYGWYYTIVYRGGVDSAGNCYDVMDNTNDQYYDPDRDPPRPGPSPRHLNAIAATWNVSLRKFRPKTGESRFFLTGYRSGTNGYRCGEERDGYRLFQKGVYYCAFDQDYSYEQILRIYLDPHLEFVDPGRHDVIGDHLGDATVLTPVPDGQLAARLYPVSAQPAVTPAAESAGIVAVDGLIGQASADMDRDGLDDLVMLTRTGDTTVRVDVARSNGAGYEVPQEWWSGDLGLLVNSARLLVADYTASGRLDVGLLLNDPAPEPEDAEPEPADAGPLPPPHATLKVLFQRPSGQAKREAATWWSGDLDVDTERTRAWTGDVNGDGAADLLVERDASAPEVSPAGIQLSLAPSAHPTAGLGPLATWLDAPDIPFTGSLGALGDLDRDGRDDLFLAFGQPGAAARLAVFEQTPKGVVRRSVWHAPEGDLVSIDQLRLALADVDFDGIADVVLYRNEGTDGTRIQVLRAGYRKVRPYAALMDATLDWTTAVPY